MSKKTGGQGWSLLSPNAIQPVAISQPPDKQRAVIALEKRNKGKVVTLVRNLKLSETDMKDLARILKTACGTGGTTRDSEIELQGDCRDRARDWLSKNGYGLK
jgi:translation initiation factor 1